MYSSVGVVANEKRDKKRLTDVSCFVLAISKLLIVPKEQTARSVR